jgi:membrane protein implicated in regulation of membrane protease activity
VVLVVVEILTLAAAFFSPGLAAALALFAAFATGSVAAVVVLVALLADLLAGERWLRTREPEAEQACQNPNCRAASH